jgi:hypothetical protein
MNARLRLAHVWETAGFPHEPPSPKLLAPQWPLQAAPAMSVAAADASLRSGLDR